MKRWSCFKKIDVPYKKEKLTIYVVDTYEKKLFRKERFVNQRVGFSVNYLRLQNLIKPFCEKINVASIEIKKKNVILFECSDLDGLISNFRISYQNFLENKNSRNVVDRKRVYQVFNHDLNLKKHYFSNEVSQSRVVTLDELIEVEQETNIEHNGYLIQAVNVVLEALSRVKSACKGKITVKRCSWSKGHKINNYEPFFSIVKNNLDISIRYLPVKVRKGPGTFKIDTGDQTVGQIVDQLQEYLATV